MESKTLNSTAVSIPSTAKPSISLSANNIIRALIINRNSPNVMIVIGNVKITKMGFTNTFKIANTTATMIADKKPSMATPGRNLANTTTTTAVMSNLIIRFIILSLEFTKGNYSLINIMTSL